MNRQRSNVSPVSLLVIVIISVACLSCVLSPIVFVLLRSQVFASGPSDDIIKEIVLESKHRSEDQVQDFLVQDKEKCFVSASTRREQHINEAWRVVVKFKLNDVADLDAPIERTEHWMIFRNKGFWFGRFEPVLTGCKTP